jgi:RND family efflux transporter MFP subunit
MKTRWRLLAALAALPVLGACKEEQVAAPVIRPVRAIVADPQGQAASLTLTGEIKARHESDHGFRVSGLVLRRMVDVGTIVKKGDVLARLDDRDQRNSVRSAEAALAAAQAEVERAKPQEARQKTLLAEGYTTQVQYDNALKNLRGAEAAVESATASLKIAQDQLKYTVLTAEFDGVITATGAEAGQVVQVGQMIVRVADPGEREAVISLAEAQLRPITPDFRIEVALLTDPAKKVAAKVREVSPIADPITRTFTVKLSLESPPPEMRLGSTVSVTGSGRSATVVSLPPGAVFDRDKKPVVWVVNQADQTVTVRPITILRNDTDRIIVSEGLAKGDIVVTAGVMKLNQGQKVKLQDVAAK